MRAVFAALALLPLPAAAAEPIRGSGAGYGPAGYGAPDRGARRLDLSIGRSAIVELPRDAKEIFVANPAIANAVVRSARKVFLIGMANGVTSIYVMDAAGQQITTLEVNVGRDLSVLRTTLASAIPTGRIEVKPAGDSILLIGTVRSPGDALQAVDIAKAFVGQSGGGAGSGGAANSAAASSGAGSAQAGGGELRGTVINALTIADRDQVMLKVTIVEMARTALKQLGLNVGGNWNVLDTGSKFVNPASTLVGIGTGLVAATAGGSNGGLNLQGQTTLGNNATIGGTLSALERAGVSRILAEPTIVAISGEQSSFQAGGEIPIVVQTACPTGQFCPPIVNYKPYGVSLSFTPIVLSEGRISVRVVTEVSEIDRDTADAITKTPGFRTRRQATTVELPSGGSMVTAGLISAQSSHAITGVPGLINLPILGALFRSREFQRRETELMILVTPYLAKPMESAQIVRPDDGFQEASDPQGILFGRLNKLYGTAGPGGPRTVPGRFGFITD